MGIRQQLKGKRAYFDTNVFIYLIEGFAAFKTSLHEIRESILHQEAEIFTSELTLCEVLVVPFRNDKSELVLTYRQFIGESGGFQLVPTSRETYMRASLMRAKVGLKLPDAIHVASAVEAGCAIFVSNDAGLRLPIGIERASL